MSILCYRHSASRATRRLTCAAAILLLATACTQVTPPGRIAAHALRAVPKDTLSEQFSEAVHALPTGALVYNAPSSMSVGRSQIVGVVLSRTFAHSIEHDLATNGPTAVTSVRIASSMKAFLVATPSAAFTITPHQNDSDPQTPDPDGRIAWSWEVLPTQAGPSELDIDIEAGVQVPGESERFFRTVKRVEIAVLAKPFWERLVESGAANWQWLLSTLLLPLGLWGIREVTARLKQRSPSA